MQGVGGESGGSVQWGVFGNVVEMTGVVTGSGQM